jgi:hypothetical protein
MITHCAVCRAYTDSQVVGTYLPPRVNNEPQRMYNLLGCPRCSTPSVVRQTNNGDLIRGDVWEDVITLYPSDANRPQSNVPIAITAALSEARASYGARAYTAAAIMCRKTLELICASHGARERSLVRSVQKLRDDGVIDDQLYNWSDALRIAGNEAAHGQGEATSESDARDMLEFTNAILEYLFSYRDRFEQFQRRRDAR